METYDEAHQDDVEHQCRIAYEKGLADGQRGKAELVELLDLWMMHYKNTAKDRSLFVLRAKTRMRINQHKNKHEGK